MNLIGIIIFQTTLIYRAHEVETHPLRGEIEETLEKSDNLKAYFIYSVRPNQNQNETVKSVGVRLSP